MNWHTAVMLRLKMLKRQICHWAHYKRCLTDCCRAFECQSYFIQSVVPMQKLYVSTTRDWREGLKTVGRIRRHHPREGLLMGSRFSVTELWNYCSELRNNTTLIHVIPLCWWRPPTHKHCRRGRGGGLHTHTNVFLNPLYLLHTHTHTKPPTLSHTLKHCLIVYCAGAVSHIPSWFKITQLDGMQWVGVGGLWKDEGVRGGQTAAVYSYHGNLCLCGEFGRDEQCYRFSLRC